MIITTKLLCKYRLRYFPEYVFHKDRCFNSKTGREIKQVYNNRCIGYNIRGRFMSLKKLKEQLEIIPKEITPF